MTENEALVRRFFAEICNERRMEVADEIVAVDFVSHDPYSESENGPDGVKASVGAYHDAVDARWEVQELIAAGDRVVVRWIGRGTHRGEIMGAAPTGRPLAVDAISIFRVADQRIAEEWTVWDAFAMLQQISDPAPTGGR
jgi:steroid delta-isomerase-like uncharacterized protein